MCLLRLGARAAVETRNKSRSGTSLSSQAQADTFRTDGVLSEFGDYQLLEEIARGGMGVVYRARQRSLHRDVAVKLVLAGQLASPESLLRFRLEAQAAARLHHPNIVEIYEIGEYDHQHFFSMELVNGFSLADCLEDFRLDPLASASSRKIQESQIAELMIRVARALDFAHQHGVLHRDLKPSNILVDDFGNPHLTDFGLAKLTGHNEAGLTLTNAVLGTPGYLAPEQAAGSLNVTVAADVYGLGATLYELLTGNPPFAESNPVETMWKAIHELPAPPRQRNPTVPRDLETIAMRCLEKRPEQRYASATDVADELERFLQNKPIHARPVSPLEQTWRWCVRNPILATLTNLLIVSVLVGVGISLWQWRRAERANVEMAQSIRRLEWDAVDDILRSGQSARALAKLASLLRENLNDPKAASFGMSIMEQRRFPIPVAPPIIQEDELTVARLSHDGTRIATASYDGAARVWDSKTSKQLFPELRHESIVNWVEFSPDGHFLATASNDRTAYLWDAWTGAAIAEPFRYELPVQRVHFGPDNRTLLIRTAKSLAVIDHQTGRQLWHSELPSGNIVDAKFLSNEPLILFSVSDGLDSRVVLFDVSMGQEKFVLKTGPFAAVDISPDLALVATVIEDKISIWDAHTGTKQSDISDEHAKYFNRLLHVKFSPDSRTFAVGGNDQYARIWDAKSGNPVTAELPHYYFLNGMAFLGHGERLLTWGHDSLARVWDTRTGKLAAEPMRHRLRIQYAEAGILDDKEVYLTTLSHIKSRSAESLVGAAQLWHIHDRKKPIELDEKIKHGAYDDACRFSPDGKLIAIAGPGLPLVVLDADRNPVCQIDSIKGLVWGIEFSPDSKRMITTSSQGEIDVWSLPDGTRLFDPIFINTVIQPLEIGADGRHFITGSTDGFVRFWDSSDGRLVFESLHGGEINSVAVSPNGQSVASAGEDHVSRVWQIPSGKLRFALKGHKNEVTRIRFSPDGNQILTSSNDHTARLWNARTGLELFSLPHQGEVMDAAFSPDGRSVATVSRDRTAMIWDSQTGRTKVRSLLHDHAVRNVSFSLDGKRLLTVDFSGLRMWDVKSGDPLTTHMAHAISAGIGFQNSSGAAQFSPDGQFVLHATTSSRPLLWNVPVPPANVPLWLPELFEAVAGQRFASSADMPEAVSALSFLDLKQKITKSTAKDYYTRWAQDWLR